MAEQLIEIEAEDDYPTPKSGLLGDQGEDLVEAKKATLKIKKKRKLVASIHSTAFNYVFFKGLEDLSRELQI